MIDDTSAENEISFSYPPLNEVVLDIQFAQIPGLLSIHANEVWELYKKEYPNIVEQPLLEPAFEKFGAVPQMNAPNFSVARPPVGSRYWFMTTDEKGLLQYQNDRIISNWRKQGDFSGYPRYERISSDFRKNITKFNEYLKQRFQGQFLKINQVEISYHNVIEIDNFREVGEFLNFLDLAHLDAEGVSFNAGEVINDKQGKPIARLSIIVNSLYSNQGKDKAITFTLAYRGKPNSEGIDDAFRFLDDGREKIITKFNGMTTAKAHQLWEKY